MQTHDGVPNFMVISAFVLCFILHAFSVGNHVIILYGQQIVMLLTKIWPCLQSCDPDAWRYLCHHIVISEAQAMFYFYVFPLLFEPELEWCCINKTSLLYWHIVLEDLVRPFQNPTLLSFNGLSGPFNFFPKCLGTTNFLVSEYTRSKCLPGLASDSMAFLFSKYYSIYSIWIFFMGIFFSVLVDYTRSLDLQPNRELLIVPQGGVGKFSAIPRKLWWDAHGSA